MSNAATNLDQISPSQAQKEVTANALFDAASPGMAYGRRAAGCGGLTWAYYGGLWPVAGAPTFIPNGTLVLTASSTCYIRRKTDDGTVDFVTSEPTDWPAENGGYAALYDVTTGASQTNNNWNDWRLALGTPGPTGPPGPDGDAGATGATGATGAPGGVTDVSTSDAALTITPTTGSVVVSANDMVGDSGSGGTHGAVPAPGTGDAAAGKFLMADGTWTVPAGGGGGGGGGMTQIAKVVTSGSATIITFNSIPGTYSDLLLTFLGRDTVTGFGDLSAWMMLNNDSVSSNYLITQYLAGSGGSATAGTQAVSGNGCKICNCPGTLSNANALGMGFIKIPNYAGTVFHKIIVSESLETYGSSLIISTRGFVYRTTGAITRIDLRPENTAFENGTTAVLYGIG